MHAHVRRKFFDLTVAGPAPVAEEALQHIGLLRYRGHHPAAPRLTDDGGSCNRRSGHARGLAALAGWHLKQLPSASPRRRRRSAMAITRWEASRTLKIDDGTIEIDNNAAERSIRPIALGRKNWLFAGSDKGGERAAGILSPDRNRSRSSTASIRRPISDPSSNASPTTPSIASASSCHGTSIRPLSAN